MGESKDKPKLVFGGAGFWDNPNTGFAELEDHEIIFVINGKKTDVLQRYIKQEVKKLIKLNNS